MFQTYATVVPNSGATNKSPQPSGRRFSSLQGAIRYFAFLFAVAVYFVSATTSFAQDGRGTITGKVSSKSSGAFLSSARISVEGTSLSAISDTDGVYRLRNVPAGEVVLVVEYGSNSIRKISLTVPDGGTVNRNVAVALIGTNLAEGSGEDDVFELEPYEITTQAQFNAAALAINEERYSDTMKDVVSTEQFGDNLNGNVGEFVKFMPGIDIEYGAGQFGNGADAGAISIRGFSSEQTKVMVDGMEVSGALTGGSSRAVGLDTLSINNASRIEISKLPTADMPDGAIGGTVNLISRSAFEYPKQRFSFRTYINMNSQNADLSGIWDKTPGPTNKYTRKAIPGIDMSYVLPLNEKFGITLGYQRNQTFNESHSLAGEWRANGSSKNAAGLIDDATNPYWYRSKITDAPRIATRTAYSLKADWKPAEGHAFSLTYNRSDFQSTDANRRLEFRNNGPTDWGSDGEDSAYSHGKAYVQMNTDFLDRDGVTDSYGLRYSLDRGPWKVTAAFSRSDSSSQMVSDEAGHFSNVDLNPAGLSTIKLDNITNSVPLDYSGYRSNGDPFDFFDINNYKVSGLDAAGNAIGGTKFTTKLGQTENKQVKDNFKVDVARDLDFISSDAVRLTAKAGFSRSKEMNLKGGRGLNYVMRYTGPLDGFDPTKYEDTSYVGQDLGYGFDSPVWVDPYKIYAFYQENPSWFSDTEDIDYQGNGSDTIAATNYKETAGSHITETTDGYYGQISGRALNNRLNFQGGVRWGEYRLDGLQTFRDKDAIKLRVIGDDSEIFLLTGNKTVDRTKDWATSYSLAERTELLNAGYMVDVNTPKAGYLVPKGSLQHAQMEYVKNTPIHTSQTRKPTQTFQAGYEVTKRLKFRAGYAASNGNAQINNGLVKSRVEIDYPDKDTDIGKISVGNPSLKPERSKQFDYSLSYYIPNGNVKVSYFTTDVTNYVVSNTKIVQDIAELEKFALYSPEFEGFELNTYFNGTGVKQTKGYEVEVDQNLEFLGDFGRNFNVWAAYSWRKTGAPDSSLGDVIPKKSASYGMSFHLGKLNGRLSALDKTDDINNAASWYILSDQTKTKKEHDTLGLPYQAIQVYKTIPQKIKLDVSLDYQLTDRYGLFFTANNILNVQGEEIWFTEEKVLPSYLEGKPVSIKDYGYNMGFGIKGRF